MRIYDFSTRSLTPIIAYTDSSKMISRSYAFTSEPDFLHGLLVKPPLIVPVNINGQTLRVIMRRSSEADSTRTVGWLLEEILHLYSCDNSAGKVFPSQLMSKSEEKQSKRAFTHSEIVYCWHSR